MSGMLGRRRKEMVCLLLMHLQHINRRIQKKIERKCISAFANNSWFVLQSTVIILYKDTYFNLYDGENTSFFSHDHDWWQSAQGELLWPAFVHPPSSCVVRRASTFLLKHLLLCNRSLDFLLNFTEIIPVWSSTKVVQTVPVGCLSNLRGQKNRFQNAIFKNLLVWNYKSQSCHIWYIASYKCPLPKLFKLCPNGQDWPRPWGHNFTLNYIRKTSNDFLSWTANWNLI